jgi:hypothetical protein
MSTNWDTLIENHFAKKKERSRLTLKKLLGTVTEVMGDMSVKDEYLLTEETGEKRFSMSIPIPRLMPSEAWGDPSSQSRQEVDRVFASITRKGGNMKSRIAHVATFLDPAQAVRKAPGGKVNTILNMMQIIEALQAALNDFNDSSAGFVFEGFMAALTGGRQEADRVGGTLPIEDFITADNENVSLKLLSPATAIHGSFTNLIDYLFIRGQTGVPSIKYLIAYKNSEDDAVAQLDFWDFDISRENFVELMSKTGNGGLFGPVASQLNQHIANYEDSNAWKLQMKEILAQTGGYNQKLGMFFKNVTREGDFFVDPEAGSDPAKKKKQYQSKRKMGRLSAMVDDAYDFAFANAFHTGTPIEDWLKDQDWANHPDLPKSLTAKTRNELRDQIDFAWNKGLEDASKEQEQEEEVVTESYFGSFHEDEKKWRKIDEESLLEGAPKGSTGGSQFHIPGGKLLTIKSIAASTNYGELDMSQSNIDQLVEIYIEKLGEDLMGLLNNTKNFSENIGRYFSADDRSEAAIANRSARDQGKEIVDSLEEREKEEEV